MIDWNHLAYWQIPLVCIGTIVAELAVAFVVAWIWTKAEETAK